jgi:electron transfer flavoprotein alpha subunit
VLWLGEHPEKRLVDDYLPTLAALLEQHLPELLLVGATRRGRAIAGRLAARLGVTVLSDVLEFHQDGKDLVVRHLIFGGGAVRLERTLRPPLVATVGQGVFQPMPAGDGARIPISEPLPFIAPPWQAQLRKRQPRAAANVNLGAARKVVCAGRGLSQQADLAMVEELARLLHAELACTRPLAEGLDWLPRERYIGISGASLHADLYLGVGVSGQVQHLIGMSGTRVVVAINKDSNAPIFANADYGIAGDLYAVVPALLKALKERGGTNRPVQADSEQAQNAPESRSW